MAAAQPTVSKHWLDEVTQ